MSEVPRGRQLFISEIKSYHRFPTAHLATGEKRYVEGKETGRLRLVGNFQCG